MFGDESADETKKRVFAVAGVVGNEDEWLHGIRDWLRITRGLPFHATDLEAKDVRDPDRQKHADNQELYKKLTLSLAGNYLVGFAVALDIHTHREVFGEGAPTDWVYFKALADVINAAGHTARTFNGLPHESDGIRLEFTFDARRESDGAAGQLYTMLTTQTQWTETDLFGTAISFEARQEPRLEMSDLLAREAMKELDRRITQARPAPRQSYSALQQSGKFIFIERDRAYWEKLRDFIVQPDNVSFVGEYFAWLERTGRVQNGQPANNMMNWIQFNAWRDRQDVLPKAP